MSAERFNNKASVAEAFDRRLSIVANMLKAAIIAIVAAFLIQFVAVEGFRKRSFDSDIYNSLSYSVKKTFL